MARTKEFDPPTALGAAVRVFWRNGYARTSTDDLVKELGIARASLYATFGSKRALYLAALDRYLAGEDGRRPEDVVETADSGLSAIRLLLESAVSMPGQGLPPGCFSTNATVVHGDDDAEISTRLEANRRRMEGLFRQALERARRDGDLGAAVDTDGAAALLGTVLNGLQVLARAGTGQHERMAMSIDAALAMVGSRPAGG
jgi:TetR/AcrR family transcriptional repressor of nem operon